MIGQARLFKMISFTKLKMILEIEILQDLESFLKIMLQQWIIFRWTELKAINFTCLWNITNSIMKI